MWAFAPNNRITEHPVRFGTADAERLTICRWRPWGIGTSRASWPRNICSGITPR
jgi:hypothetical protein